MSYSAMVSVSLLLCVCSTMDRWKCVFLEFLFILTSIPPLNFQACKNGTLLQMYCIQNEVKSFFIIGYEKDILIAHCIDALFSLINRVICYSYLSEMWSQSWCTSYKRRHIHSKNSQVFPMQDGGGEEWRKDRRGAKQTGRRGQQYTERKHSQEHTLDASQTAR